MRYKLRTLMVVLAVFCTVLAVWAERARRQQTAVAALREIGVHVAYATERDELNFTDDTRTLCRIIPADYVYSATMVIVERHHALQALPMLKRLPQLCELRLRSGYQGDDEVVKTLERELPRVKVATFKATMG